MTKTSTSTSNAHDEDARSIVSLIEDDVRRFVESQRIARLATVDHDGKPHVVPICFALVEDRLYTAIDEKPKTPDVMRIQRLRNIAANAQVQVLLDAYNDSDWSQLRYVQLRGRARVVSFSELEHANALAALRTRYAQYHDMQLESLPVIAVDVERIVAWPREK